MPVWLLPRRLLPGRGDVHGRHGDRRHQVRPQQRPRRQEVPARDARLGRRVPRRQQRRLARHPPDQLQGLEAAAARRSLHALYRNNKNGTFTDVTAGSGLDVEMYGMGVAVGDYDNDGRDDVYITALEGDRLFHNEGNFKFRDVTKASGIANANFGTSAAWVDYDRDGRLDLFVANYVQWTREGRSVLLARRLDEVVLHAGVVQGHRIEAVSEPRRRPVRRT